MGKEPVKIYDLPFFLRVGCPTNKEELSFLNKSDFSTLETIRLVSQYKKSAIGFYLLDSYSLNPQTSIKFDSLYDGGIGAKKISSRKAEKRGFNDSHVAYGTISAKLVLPNELETLEILLEEKKFFAKVELFKGLAKSSEDLAKDLIISSRRIPLPIFPTHYSIHGLHKRLAGSSIDFSLDTSNSLIGEMSRFGISQEN